MEQEKDACYGQPDFLPEFQIQFVDLLRRQLHQSGVFGQRFLLGIEKIGEQREVQAGIAVGQEADFQRLDQAVDAGRAGQHGGHHNQGSPGGRDAFGEIHFRQRVRCDEQAGRPVHERDGQLAGRQQRHQAEQYHRPQRQTGRYGAHDQAAGKQAGDDADAAEVNGQRHAPGRPAHAFGESMTNLDGAFELRQTGANQVITDVRPRPARPILRCAS